MVRAENPAVSTRDKIAIEISTPDRTDILVKLSGELDVHDLRTLHETLSLVLSTGLSTIVDLSDVTFLDVRCARELAVRSCFDDHLMLSDPSLQAKASFRVCGCEVRVSAYSDNESSLGEPSQQPQGQQERAGVEHREASALAV